MNTTESNVTASDSSDSLGTAQEDSLLTAGAGEAESLAGEDAGEDGFFSYALQVGGGSGEPLRLLPLWLAIFSETLLLVLFILSLILHLFRKKRMRTLEEDLESCRRHLQNQTVEDASPTTVREESTQEMEEHGGEGAGARVRIPASPSRISWSSCQQIGTRSSQQDSFGAMELKDGIFAVVADGMGGLRDGDKASQNIVQTMMGDASCLDSPSAEGILYRMLSHANQELNAFLGSEGLGVCGSTVVAVVAGLESFQWISVGDSRIYLYHVGELMQMNPEHIYQTELTTMAVNGDISFADSQSHQKRYALTSYMGMGKLHYIGGSRRPISLRQGDRVLLLSDGVFNTIPETTICRLLMLEQDPRRAAEALESAVQAADNRHQDNYTAIVIAFD